MNRIFLKIVYRRLSFCRAYLYLISLVFIFLSSCGKFSDKVHGKIYHPTEKNIPDKKILASHPSINSNDFELSVEKKEILDRLNGGTEIATFGESENEGYKSFLRIHNMAMDNKGHVFLLVDRLKKVLVFNVQGKYVASIGREGRGPGEFLNPKSLSSDEKGRLYVLDRTEIDVFHYVNNSFKYERPIKHNLSHSVDLCIMNNKLFVSGFSIIEEDTLNGKETGKKKYPISISPPIYMFDLKTKEHIKSFGKLYQSASGWPVFTGMLSETYLACDQESNVILGMSAHFPYLYGYTSKGNVKWVSAIEGFKYAAFVEETGNIPALSREISEEPYHVVRQFENIGKGYTILQIGLRAHLPQKGGLSVLREAFKNLNPKLKTLLINSASGEVTYISHTLNRTLLVNKNYKITIPIENSILEALDRDHTVVHIYRY